MSNEKEEFDHNAGWKSDAVAEQYDKQRFSSLAGRIYNEREKKAISDLLSVAQENNQINTVLDVPCGTGRISEFLLQKGYGVSCGDISNEMITVATKRLAAYQPGVNDFSILDIYNIAKDPDSYDCVTCIRLFQHLMSDERARALRELARVSKRYVIVNVMYNSFYYGILRGLRLALGRYAPRYTANKQELERELKFASLRMVKSIFTQPGYNGNLVLLLEKEQ